MQKTHWTDGPFVCVGVYALCTRFFIYNFLYFFCFYIYIFSFFCFLFINKKKQKENIYRKKKRKNTYKKQFLNKKRYKKRRPFLVVSVFCNVNFFIYIFVLQINILK